MLLAELWIHIYRFLLPHIQSGVILKSKYIEFLVNNVIIGALWANVLKNVFNIWIQNISYMVQLCHIVRKVTGRSVWKNVQNYSSSDFKRCGPRKLLYFSRRRLGPILLSKKGFPCPHREGGEDVFPHSLALPASGPTCTLDTCRDFHPSPVCLLLVCRLAAVHVLFVDLSIVCLPGSNSLVVAGCKRKANFLLNPSVMCTQSGLFTTSFSYTLHSTHTLSHLMR